MSSNSSRESGSHSSPASAKDFDSSFVLSFRYRFESAHRFTRSCADSCATPHGHTWFAEAFFNAPGTELGADDMVMEFSQLKKSFKRFITETVDHSFMHHFEDPILPALREFIPQFRGLPFPGDPTTELIAALFFAKVQTMHAHLHMSVPNAIWPNLSEMLVQETPTNGIRFRLPPQSPSASTPLGGRLLGKINSEFEGWWQDPNPESRHIKRI